MIVSLKRRFYLIRGKSQKQWSLSQGRPKEVRWPRGQLARRSRVCRR